MRHGKLTADSGRVAQRKSTRLTSGGSLVRTQPCPPAKTPERVDCRAGVDSYSDIQAMYFAWRTATGDLTGIDDASGNEKRLADARAMLAG